MKVVAAKSGWVVEDYLDDFLIGYEIDDNDGTWTLTSDPFMAKIYPSEEMARQSDLFANVTSRERLEIRFMRLTSEIERYKSLV